MSNQINHLYDFDEFRLDAENPSLWQNNKLVSIPPKALDILILLVKRNGEIVSREDLLENIWRETFVEEGNINYTISLLRKTLGSKEFIQTVPKRGYRFVGEIKQNELVELPHRKFPWVLLSIFLVGLIVVASFAFWRRNNQPETSKIQSANAEASAAYTRGKMILEKKGVENREEKAIDEFQKAVTLDPTFALAYIGLAEGFSTSAIKFPGEKSLDYYAKAKAAAQKALNLDANLAEALSIRGWLKRNADWDWEGAENDLRRAIELNPEIALSHYRLSYILAPRGKMDEALVEIKKAYQLDPVSELVSSGRFPILESRGEFDEALKLAESYLQENKENPFAQRAYATFLFHKKDFPKVIELGETAIQKKDLRNGFAWLSLLVAAYQQTGNPERAEQNLKELEILAQSDTKALYSLAINYAELGRADETIKALQKCLELREERLFWMKTEPRFANLKNDSRFLEILKKVGLN